MWLLIVLLLAGAETPQEPTQTRERVHEELTREAASDVLPGALMSCGYGDCRLYHGFIVKYQGTMASSGEGEWDFNEKSGVLEIKGAVDEGASDDAGESMTGSPFNARYEDCWGSSSDLAPSVLVCRPAKAKKHEVYMGAPEDGAQKRSDVTLVKVIPAKGSAAQHKKVLEKLAADDDLVVFEGSQAKNARSASEVWWKGDGQREAAQVAKELEPIIGPTKLREWTWGGPPYQVIVVVAP